MARSRSPNYPAIGLGQTIEAAKALWAKEQRTAVPPEVAVKAWGYKSLSGPARTRLAALKHYGLLEEDRHGVRLSERALQIIHQPAESSEYQEAVREAALAPELFRELRETHASASDDALKAHLVTKRKFTEEGAKLFIEAFRDTIDIAKLRDSAYDQGKESSGVTGMGVFAPISTTETLRSGAKRQYMVYSGPVSRGMLAEVRLAGDEEISPRHIEALIAHLELAKETIKPDDEDSKDEPNAKAGGKST